MTSLPDGNRKNADASLLCIPVFGGQTAQRLICSDMGENQCVIKLCSKIKTNVLLHLELPPLPAPAKGCPSPSYLGLPSHFFLTTKPTGWSRDLPYLQHQRQKELQKAVLHWSDLL